MGLRQKLCSRSQQKFALRLAGLWRNWRRNYRRATRRSDFFISRDAPTVGTRLITERSIRAAERSHSVISRNTRWPITLSARIWLPTFRVLAGCKSVAIVARMWSADRSRRAMAFVNAQVWKRGLPRFWHRHSPAAHPTPAKRWPFVSSYRGFPRELDFLR